MKTFEERYRAWIEGHMSPEAQAAFELELEKRGPLPETPAELAGGARVGQLLREHSPVPVLANPDFFNHQIMHRIKVESDEVRPERRRWSWSLPQLAWTGGFSLLVALALFKTVIPAASHSDPMHGAGVGATGLYFAEIVDVRSSDPNVSATPVYDPKDNVTVLWLDGLDYLPDSYQLQ